MSDSKVTGTPTQLNGTQIKWDDSEMVSAYANVGTATANRSEAGQPHCYDAVCSKATCDYLDAVA
jgi:hypothetical protein